MALTGEQTFRGLTMANAYVRVMSVHHRAVDSPSTTLYADYTVRIYKDADARTAGDAAIDTITGSFTPSIANSANLNIVKQTYVHLKTLADYDELTDV
tara:strand:- start:100 stop:393 length:294 start_codon:yes stop_codon:yes gene_type:complete